MASGCLLGTWFLAWLLFPASYRLKVPLSVTAVLFIFLLAPEFLGEAQFEALCKARGTVWISPALVPSIRLKPSTSRMQRLEGTWVPITAQVIEYQDERTGAVLAREEALHTKGGGIGQLISLGQSRSCWPSDFVEKNDFLDGLTQKADRK